jgi:hemolysin III
MKRLMQLILRGILSLLQKLALYRSEHHVNFSFGWFSVYTMLVTACWLALLYFLLGWLLPTVLVEQLNDPWWVYLICFAVFHLGVAFFEHPFHRYILHNVFWRFLRSLCRKHEEHHRLTVVREIRHNPTPDGRVNVRNRYPIVEPEQIESSAFPAWALVTFWGLFTPLIVLLQVTFPALPWVVTGYLAIAWSLWLYEVKHAIEHLDYEKVWKRWVERPDWLGKIARTIYGFHLMHHSRVRVNQAISGFFGIPVPDLVFGTYFVPKELPLPGAVVDPATQEPPPACRFTRWLDRIVEACEARIVAWDKLQALAKAGRR